MPIVVRPALLYFFFSLWCAVKLMLEYRSDRLWLDVRHVPPIGIGPCAVPWETCTGVGGRIHGHSNIQPFNSHTYTPTYIPSEEEVFRTPEYSVHACPENTGPGRPGDEKWHQIHCTPWYQSIPVQCNKERGIGFINVVGRDQPLIGISGRGYSNTYGTKGKLYVLRTWLPRAVGDDDLQDYKYMMFAFCSESFVII